MFLAAAAPLIGLAGAGVSAYSQIRAGREQDALARTNLLSQQQAIRQQGAIALMQSRMQEISAQQSAQALAIDSQNERNAAEYESRAAQENIRRQREDFSRALAEQRAAIAARGVVDTTGSPLELLLRSAEDQAFSEANARAADEMNRRARFTRASGLDYQSRVAGLNRGSAILAGMAAKQQVATGLAQASIDYRGSRAASTGQMFGAAGTLLEGAMQYGTRRSQLQQITTPRL
jgi:hypothetical protein